MFNKVMAFIGHLIGSTAVFLAVATVAVGVDWINVHLITPTAPGFVSDILDYTSKAMLVSDIFLLFRFLFAAIKKDFE